MPTTHARPGSPAARLRAEARLEVAMALPGASDLAAVLDVLEMLADQAAVFRRAGRFIDPAAIEDVLTVVHRPSLRPDVPVEAAASDRAALTTEWLDRIADPIPAGACQRCAGDGRIADSDDGEPWRVWETMPPGSDLAVRLGLVHPITCPACNGSGSAAVAEQVTQQRDGGR